jgi:hypothetical protein
MVAIVRFVSPVGKSFITRAPSWRVSSNEVSGRVYEKALVKYGAQNFVREVLWKDDSIKDENNLIVVRKFNKFVNELEPEYNI